MHFNTTLNAYIYHITLLFYSFIYLFVYFYTIFKEGDILSSMVSLPYGTLNINIIYRGSYMSAHVLLNLLNELGKRVQMRGLPSILSLFRNKFNKFNKTRARM